MPDLKTAVLESFPQCRIVIVGDLIADQFLDGSISRVSREAPVFILKHKKTDTVPGGAANAAMNVASLGGRASLVGIVGADEPGDALIAKLEAAGVDCTGVIRAEEHLTTRKLRVLAGQDYAARQQVIRIDYESVETLDQDRRHQLVEAAASRISDADAVVISDYGYGTACDEVMEMAVAKCRAAEIPLIADSRYDLTRMRAATTATPNREEVEHVLGAGYDAAQCEDLRKRLELNCLLVTNGNKGMSLYIKDHAPTHIPAVGSTVPVDVTGAGDTVIAAYSLGLASRLGYLDAAVIANHAGGIAVMKHGTATVTPEELSRSLELEPDQDSQVATQ